AYWHRGESEFAARILVIHSNLSNLAGLHLSVPVKADVLQFEPAGEVTASYVRRTLGGNHKIQAYWKRGLAGLTIGELTAPVRVQRDASRQLLKACGVTTIEELKDLTVPELDAA
ncbi:MAG TPA: hypothetical protein VFK97_03155, partial [Candidatus Saccharimonadales bacterium]|nr:hypothetical protein [Candidatus Saccharimonadales bacterium]